LYDLKHVFKSHVPKEGYFRHFSILHSTSSYRKCKK